MLSTNNVTIFLNEEIFPGKKEEFKTKNLYSKYKTWCKKRGLYAYYGRNKFYEMIKLSTRIRFEHQSDGDYFIIGLDNMKNFKMPF